MNIKYFEDIKVGEKYFKSITYKVEKEEIIEFARHWDTQMNKLDLIEALQKKAGISKNKAESVVNLFTNEISTALATGDRVEIHGLCSFCVKNYRAYTGRNPKIGEHVNVKAKKLPFFKCGKELKERVDS